MTHAKASPSGLAFAYLDRDEAMTNSIIQKSKPMRGVRDYSVQAQKHSTGLIEIDFKVGKFLLTKICFLLRYYQQCDSPYNKREFIRTQCKTSFDYLDATTDRLLDEAVKAVDQM